MPRSSDLRFPKYREITQLEVNCDLHIHTAQTDGKARIEEVIVRASQLGLRRIAFTEHVRKSTSWFRNFALEVRRAAGNHPEIEVLVGCEAKALDARGALDASPDILADCDIVLGSVHRFPGMDGGYADFASLTPEEILHTEYGLAVGLLEGGSIDVLAHPGGMYARRCRRDLPADLLEKLMIRARDAHIAIEINSSYLHDASQFLAICAEVNPLVSIGSDMHDLKDLGSCRDMIIPYVKRKP